MNGKEINEEKRPMLELIFIEDEKENAESLYVHIGLQKFSNAHFFDDCRFLDSNQIDNSNKKVYFVDINLGTGKQKEGLNIIKKIRTVDPSSLIIVYSALNKFEEESISIGANYFRLKEPELYEDDIIFFRNLIKREIQIP